MWYVCALAENTCCMQSAIWRLPLQVDGTLDEMSECGGVRDLPALEQVCKLDTEPHGQDVKVTCFHPSDGSRAASVVDNKFIIWDLNSGDSAKVTVSCVDVQTGKDCRCISLNLELDLK
jgi:WD40 repeat protein